MDAIQSIVAAVAAVIMLLVSLVTGGAGGVQDNQTVAVPANNTTITASPSITARPSASPSPVAVKHSGDPQVDNLIDITCAPFAYGLKDPVTWRWNRMSDPHMAVVGQPTQEDKRQIQACADVIFDKFLVAYTKLDIGVKEEYLGGYDVIIYVGSPDRSDYFLNYYNNDKYHQYHPYSAGDHDLAKGGYMMWKDSRYPWESGGGSCNAVIVLPDTLTQEQRSYYIWKYMAAIMGAHGSSKNSDSIFYPTPNWRTGYSADDMWVLETYYAKGTNLGQDFTADMVIQALVEHKPFNDIVNMDAHAQTFGG